MPLALVESQHVFTPCNSDQIPVRPSALIVKPGIDTAKDGRFLEMLNFQKFGILTDSARITCGMI